MKWHVLHLHPRCEKKMAQYCDIHRLQYYLPLREESKVYQRRRVTVTKPVFPGYFFVRFDYDGKIVLLQTNHVVRVLVPDRQRPMLHQLAQVRKALAVDRTLGACTMLRKGKRVRIVAGPFAGIEGIVASMRGRAKVMLNVEMIGQAVAVEAERDALEIID